MLCGVFDRMIEHFVDILLVDLIDEEKKEVKE